MENILVHSSLTHTIRIKAHKFSNDKELILNFGEDVEPAEIPKDILKVYQATKPGRYLVGEVEPELEEPTFDGFNPVEFMETHEITEEHLNGLGVKELFTLSEVCGVKNLHPKTGKIKLIQRILGAISSETNE